MKITLQFSSGLFCSRQTKPDPEYSSFKEASKALLEHLNRADNMWVQVIVNAEA